jgi:GNAT superfamily N-acetyltransferase
MNGRTPLPELTVRPIATDDEERLRRLFDRLSARTVYRRFFTLFPTLPPSLLRYLARVSDDDHEELVALHGDDIVAVASWDRVANGSDEAELAILVEDAWQQQGLGAALMRMVTAEAHRHGIAHLTANILSENDPANRLARSLAQPERVERDGPATAFTFSLAS